MTVVPLNRPRNGARGSNSEKSPIVAALDVGSSKICCVIGRADQTRRRIDAGASELKVLGVGHQASRGIRNGVVVNIEEAERAIRLAVDAAERMAGQTITEVYVNVSGGRPRCETYHASVEIGGDMVSGHHLHQAAGLAMQKIDAGRRLVLHATPVQFDLDDARGVRKPEGMYGDNLTVTLNAVTVEQGALRNLQMAVEHCHLHVAGYVMAPYAAGRSALVEDEITLGVTFIDMGGATTSLSVFSEGNLLFADVLPVGGNHITADIACGLSTSLAHAERLKTMSGSVLPSLGGDDERVVVPLLGETGSDTVARIPRSQLNAIIKPRVEEIFELARTRLEASSAGRRAGRRVVLSGGGSLLTGIRETAGSILKRHVRLAQPHGVSAMPDMMRTPAFCVAAGLLKYAAHPDERTLELPQISGGKAVYAGRLSRMGRWLKESF